VQDSPLTFGQVVTDSVRWGVITWEKANDNIAGALLEFRLRLARCPAQFDD
jgi:hypothetical protein